MQFTTECYSVTMQAPRRQTMKRRHLLAAGCASLAAPALVRAQAFPVNKPIRYIVPVAAGGGSDMVGRTVTERWGKLLGQTFVVDNQGGGGGVIACQTTMRAAPDGYTLLQGYVATHGTSPPPARCPTTRSRTSPPSA
jgi:tripartite-type tricarboxylate transporter receptor subunit TctC